MVKISFLKGCIAVSGNGYDPIVDGGDLRL